MLLLWVSADDTDRPAGPASAPRRPADGAGGVVQSSTSQAGLVCTQAGPQRAQENTEVSEQTGQRADELTVDADNLYREEVFTDLRAASIRRLSPVNSDGSPDGSRAASYIGDTTLIAGMPEVRVGIPSVTLIHSTTSPTTAKAARNSTPQRAARRSRERCCTVWPMRKYASVGAFKLPKLVCARVGRQ